MDKVLGALAAVVVLGWALWGMRRSWRARGARDAAIQGAAELSPGAELWSGRVQYVASARTGAPLDRLAAPGLGFRGPAEFTVLETGVRFAVQGSIPVSIPRAQLHACDTSSWAIDRGVGANGLLRISWSSLDTSHTTIDSSFRFASADEQLAASAAITSLILESSATENS